MKKHVWSALLTATACAWAVVTAAQTPGQTSASPTRPDAQSEKSTVTVTGCLLRASPSGVAGATGTSGTATAGMASATPNEPHFILIAIGTAPSPTAPATAGATNVPVSAMVHRLVADDAKLAGHVGEKVEITGALEPALPTMAPATASPAPTGTAGESASASSPRIKVETVRTVAATCGQ